MNAARRLAAVVRHSRFTEQKDAARRRDSEETRRFYEEFLGLPLSHTIEIKETKSGRKTGTLHTFHALDDGSCLALRLDAWQRQKAAVTAEQS